MRMPETLSGAADMISAAFMDIPLWVPIVAFFLWARPKLQLQRDLCTERLSHRPTSVSLRASVQLSNASPQPLRIVIEPWAIEFALPSRSSCEVFSVGGSPPAQVDAEMSEYGVIFYVETAGGIYEYWRDGQLID